MELNDTQLSTVIGLAGSLVGALAALAGTWLTLWHTRHLAKEERSVQKQEQAQSKLFEAYVEWLTAADQSRLLLTNLMLAADRGDWSATVALLDEGRQQVNFRGWKLFLLEPDSNVHEHFRTMLQVYDDALFAIAKPQASLSERGAASRKAIDAIGGVCGVLWSKFHEEGALTKSPSPSEPRTLPEPTPAGTLRRTET